MHIVIIAWLYVIVTMSLTLSWPSGIALFLLAGVAPVVLYIALALRRLRARRARASVLEHEVDTGDHRDAERDQ
jgi:hypothetical protein